METTFDILDFCLKINMKINFKANVYLCGEYACMYVYVCVFFIFLWLKIESICKCIIKVLLYLFVVFFIEHALIH